MVLKELCNRLMAFQAEKAQIKPEVMKSMNFENRLQPDFEEAEKKYITVAWEGDKPVGFAFAMIEDLEENNLSRKPSWAEDLDGLGFYPADYEAPKKIGTFKLLFVMPEYRGLDIGGELCRKTMGWLENQKDVDDLWVYVANGNEDVGRLYEKIGFTFSHTVYGGFIQAYRLMMNN